MKYGNHLSRSRTEIPYMTNHKSVMVKRVSWKTLVMRQNEQFHAKTKTKYKVFGKQSEPFKMLSSTPKQQGREEDPKAMFQQPRLAMYQQKVTGGQTKVKEGGQEQDRLTFLAEGELQCAR